MLVTTDADTAAARPAAVQKAIHAAETASKPLQTRWRREVILLP